MESFLFYTFSAGAVLSALCVISAPRPTRALLALIAAMFCLAILFGLLGAPFMAMVHLIVYAGAVLVLFLFVIMLVNLDEAAKQRQFNHQWTIALGCALAVLAELTYFLVKGKERAAGSCSVLDKQEEREGCGGFCNHG